MLFNVVYVCRINKILAFKLALVKTKEPAILFQAIMLLNAIQNLKSDTVVNIFITVFKVHRAKSSPVKVRAIF